MGTVAVLAWFLPHLWHFVWAWYYSHGVPGNLAASAITGALAGLGVHRLVWRKHVKPHIDKVHEIHAHLDPSHPFTLGGSNGEGDSGR